MSMRPVCSRKRLITGASMRSEVMGLSLTPVTYGALQPGRQLLIPPIRKMGICGHLRMLYLAGFRASVQFPMTFTSVQARMMWLPVPATHPKEISPKPLLIREFLKTILHTIGGSMPFKPMVPYTQVMCGVLEHYPKRPQ